MKRSKQRHWTFVRPATQSQLRDYLHGFRRMGNTRRGIPLQFAPQLLVEYTA